MSQTHKQIGKRIKNIGFTFALKLTAENSFTATFFFKTRGR